MFIFFFKNEFSHSRKVPERKNLYVIYQGTLKNEHFDFERNRLNSATLQDDIFQSFSPDSKVHVEDTPTLQHRANKISSRDNDALSLENEDSRERTAPDNEMFTEIETVLKAAGFEDTETFAKILEIGRKYENTLCKTKNDTDLKKRK